LLPPVWTASVIFFQAATCASLQMPGTSSLPLVADRRGFGDDQAGTGAF